MQGNHDGHKYISTTHHNANLCYSSRYIWRTTIRNRRSIVERVTDWTRQTTLNSVVTTKCTHIQIISPVQKSVGIEC